MSARTHKQKPARIDLLTEYTASCLAIDTEAPGLEVKMGVRPYAVTMCDGKNSWYFLWKVDPFTRKVLPKKSDVATILKIAKKYKYLVFHNAKFDVGMLASVCIDFRNRWDNIHDTAIASHALDSREDFSRHRLKPLAKRYLGIPDNDEQALQAKTIEARKIAKDRGWNVHEDVKADYWMPGQIWPKDKSLEEYATTDAERTWLLWVKVFVPALIDQNLFSQYMKHRRVMEPIFDMEDHGITIRPMTLDSEIKRIGSMVTEQAQIAHSQVPAGICENLNSGKQLQAALFDHFKLPVLYRTEPSKLFPNGQPSTDAETLKELSAIAKPGSKAYKFLDALRTYAKADTALTYLSGYHLRKVLNKLYPSYNICGTATLRLSSSNPNAQNVGKGKELEFDDGTKQIEFRLRTVFGPTAGRVWYTIDYDQLQLRIFAKASGEERMQRAFADGYDFHTWMGCEIFGVRPEDLTKLQRRIAKNVNFGYIFGAGPAKIESTSGMKGLSAKLKKMFPNVADFMKETISTASQYGYVYTLGGYRLSIERKRAYAGVCILVQGTEGEIVKEAMFKVHNRLKPYGDDFYMTMQVHDELVFDAALKTKKTHLDLLRNIKQDMEDAGRISTVETIANPEIVVNNWADANKLAL